MNRAILYITAGALGALWALGRETSKGIPGQASAGVATQIAIGWAVVKNKIGIGDVARPTPVGQA